MTGKTDFYVPFVGRAVEWLTDEGRLGFLTPNRYLGRDYGYGLRKHLPQEGDFEYILDFGEVGKVFFPKITNYPCVTVFQRSPDIRIDSIRYAEVKKETSKLGRGGIVALLRRLLAALSKRTRSLAESDVHTFLVPQERTHTDGRPYILHPAGALKERLLSLRGTTRASTLVTMEQGVTPGGEGALGIYTVSARVIESCRLDLELIRKALEGEDIGPWNIGWKDKYAIYPYIGNGGADPVYLGDFEGVPANARVSALDSMVASGKVKHPGVAKYLLDSYDELAVREFEGKTLRQLNKLWYEYHRPRTPSAMLRSGKIVAKRRLFARPGFALDDEGYLPFDTCAVMTVRNNKIVQTLEENLKTLAEETTRDPLLGTYLLAMLNSELCEFMMKVGRTADQGRYYSLTEDTFDELSIPISFAGKQGQCKRLLSLAQRPRIEQDIRELNDLIYDLYELKSKEKEEIRAYLECH